MNFCYALRYLVMHPLRGKKQGKYANLKLVSDSEDMIFERFLLLHLAFSYN